MSIENFRYGITRWAPLQDPEVCERVRRISRDQFCRHDNPDFQIEIVPDDEISFRRVYDIFSRIKEAAEQERNLVLILPNPHPQYIKVAYLINKFRVPCRHLYIFNMDEWADEEGNIAPETWPNGFMYAMKNYFYARIDPELRPPEDHIQGPNNGNLDDYGRMIEDVGGADVCYGGIGWSGHVAFVEPGSPEFQGSGSGDLEEFKAMGTRIVTLSPWTIAQSCLDADFGMSGNWAWIPPRAATIGPKEVLAARQRRSWNSFTISATEVSWQRFTVRLAAHGPISPAVPASILQIGPTHLFASESIAADIESRRDLSWYK